MSRPLNGGRHDWLGFLAPTGLVVAPAVLERLGLWPEPQGPEEGRALADALAALEAGHAWPLFGAVLGWPADRVAGAAGGPVLPERLTVSLREGETLLAPDWAVLGGEGVQLLVRLEARDAPLDRRGAADGWEATPHQRFERLLRETGVGAGVLIGWRETGRTEDALVPELRLVAAPKGEQSGWIAWPLAALGEVSGRGMLAGLKLLLDSHALFTGAPSHRLLALLAESRAAQAEVTTKLAGQVLASLHELLRGLDSADPTLVRDLATRDPHRLYEGLLTVLLRLIFILYSEDRGLLLAGGGGAASLYEQGYSVGGLHARLRDDEALYPDIMDERRGAWGRLLALFGLVERGADGFMQKRGGKLFDRDAFPFLLGRRACGEPERVLPVSDGCVLRVLDHLLLVDGERVRYRNLDVEKLGSVYETVMGFTVLAADAPMLAIRAGKGNKVPVWVDLQALAAAHGGERARLLKAWTGRATLSATVARGLRGAVTVADVEAALAPIVDARASPLGQRAAPDTPVLQPTDERRRTGSHYTPRSLTEPIVAHALEPAFARIGADATPGEVLELKVCDPAAGSGAFLVEACRQLGARLVRAWERWPAQRPTIPLGEDDLLHAKRLVAQHCLRGVDKNPLALDLAKLSLWLETLASGHEFTFLDHLLRVGDSLVGLPNAKIRSLSWGKTTAQHHMVEVYLRDGIKAAAELGRLMRAEAEIAPYSVQEGRYREATVALERAKLVADAILESFFAGTSLKAREVNLATVEQFVSAPSPQSWERLAILRDRLRCSPIGITSFHWELEFEDVFTRENPGFDAIVGNPPFAGKNTIASGHPTAYPDWLKTLHPGAHGNADLAAHFFRRAFGLLRRGGAFGLIATNTIRQGDTRESGLARIIAEGGVIFRAVSRYRWEGEAAVVVSMVFVRRGEELPLSSPARGRWPTQQVGGGGLPNQRSASSPSVSLRLPPPPRGGGSAVLDGKPVSRISAYLIEGELDGSPAALGENAGKSFIGSFLLGMGFTFDDVNAGKGKATPLAEMERLIAADPRNGEVIKPYLGGEEINNSPTFLHHRYAIDFGDRPLNRLKDGRSWAKLTVEEQRRQLREGLVAPDYPMEVAGDWPELLGIIERLVKPERDRDNREIRRRRWWQYAEKAPQLYDAISDFQRVLVRPQVSPHHAFGFVPAKQVLALTIVNLALPRDASFATLQSRVHEVWTRSFASTLEDRMRYTPSDCFETFPLPPGHADDPKLEATGRAYHDHRAALMVARDQGMTPTYNRFHDADDTAEDIAELRRLHAAMDHAVLAAYGWDDLAEAAAPVFLDETSEGDHQYQARLHWPAPFRDALLARLLRLNEERARMERIS